MALAIRHFVEDVARLESVTANLTPSGEECFSNSKSPFITSIPSILINNDISFKSQKLSIYDSKLYLRPEPQDLLVHSTP